MSKRKIDEDLKIIIEKIEQHDKTFNTMANQLNVFKNKINEILENNYINNFPYRHIHIKKSIEYLEIDKEHYHDRISDIHEMKIIKFKQTPIINIIEEGVIFQFSDGKFFILENKVDDCTGEWIGWFYNYKISHDNIEILSLLSCMPNSLLQDFNILLYESNRIGSEIFTLKNQRNAIRFENRIIKKSNCFSDVK